jgi:hypothetical protein
MSNVDYMVSQIPFMGEYTQAGLAYWNASRHPENIRDIREEVKASAELLSLKDKVMLAGTTAITLAQQLPVNEMLVGMGVGVALEQTGGSIPAAIATAAVITGTAELSSGVGVAHSVEKFRPAMDTLSDRYIDQKKVEEKRVKYEESGKKPMGDLLRTYTAASIVLTSGATLYESLRDRSRTLKDNLRTAKIASAMVVANYCAVTGVVVGVAGVSESIGVDDATEKLAEGVSNPLLMGLFVGAVMVAAKLREHRKLVKQFKQKKASSVMSEKSEEQLSNMNPAGGTS